MKAEDIFKDLIVRTVARLMVPFILLFGLYVLLHGHASPGGGFQAGVIIAAGFILMSLAFNMDELKRRVPLTFRLITGSFGPINYVVIGIACILSGGYFLQYGVVPLPSLAPADVSAVLISAVEIGIGITVLGMVTGMILSMTGGSDDHT